MTRGSFLSRLSIVMALTVLPVGIRGTVAQQAPAPEPESVLAQVRAHRLTHEASILREFCEFLTLPNVSADREAIRKNADLLLTLLRRRGIEARLLEVEGSPPVVFGELNVPGAERTVVFYAHYDGQPVDPAQWSSDPWKPVLRSRSMEAGGEEIPFPEPGRFSGPIDPEARIYARSASDDKAPIIALLTALDALHAAGIQPSVNIRFFFEGEEEAGSPHIRTMLEMHADLLEADVWFFCDGPVHLSRRQEVNFGVRGIVGVQMTVVSAAPSTQRTLRQLGAPSDGDARPPAGRHAGYGREGPRRGILR